MKPTKGQHNLLAYMRQTMQPATAADLAHRLGRDIGRVAGDLDALLSLGKVWRGPNGWQPTQPAPPKRNRQPKKPADPARAPKLLSREDWWSIDPKRRPRLKAPAFGWTERLGACCSEDRK